MEEKLEKILLDLNIGYITVKVAKRKILRLFAISRAFYCQSEIEGNRKCINQCEHCKEYYKPLEQ